jgi:hypothetical protein
VITQLDCSRLLISCQHSPKLFEWNDNEPILPLSDQKRIHRVVAQLYLSIRTRPDLVMQMLALESMLMARVKLLVYLLLGMDALLRILQSRR